MPQPTIGFSETLAEVNFHIPILCSADVGSEIKLLIWLVRSWNILKANGNDNEIIAKIKLANIAVRRPQVRTTAAPNIPQPSARIPLEKLIITDKIKTIINPILTYNSGYLLIRAKDRFLFMDFAEYRHEGKVSLCIYIYIY